MTEQDIAKVYRALGDPTRLRMVRLLCRHGELGCAQLAEELNISRPTLSHHTGVLQDCGLIGVRKDGPYHFFHLDYEVLERYAPTVAASEHRP